ncbi:MAG: hypothetical protein L6R42_004832 [Xanthoria sp. 1 TBL-2021]|nr:MAG: hypothetical protein L6R42_004832 [Xanthoria sp. 1 TBL-2021]
MAIRGQRFHVDLESEYETGQPQDGVDLAMPRSPWGLVTDIQERSTSTTIKPPSPPRIKNSQDGFPIHKKRSRFGGSKQVSDRTSLSDGNMKRSMPELVPSRLGSFGANRDISSERHEIDLENKQRLAGMSSEDINQARRELMSGLTPSLIEKLLRKANIEEDQEVENGPETVTEKKVVSSRLSTNKKVNFDLKDAGIASSQPSSDVEDPAFDPEDTPINPPADLQPVTVFSGYPAPPSIHFPRPPTPPALDPEDPEFLSKLHSTYFPSLPSNPNALSWMQPPDPAENEAYSPSLDNLLPSAVRFDFRGRLLPPRLASQIPPTKGLHHHGTAPEAAGYTVPELAHLSRSSFPSQRCIAYQTLGRILYRLGTGVFGPEDHELCQGLWKCIEQGRVLETLTAEAARDGASGNRTCWVTATEAVWLWRKGGGRKWKAT